MLLACQSTRANGLDGGLQLTQYDEPAPADSSTPPGPNSDSSDYGNPGYSDDAGQNPDNGQNADTNQNSTVNQPSYGAGQGRYSQAPTGRTRNAYPPPIAICSEDVPPPHMVITGTATSPVCLGACRGRLLEPVRGPIMIICAHQPVPDGYVLDSVTTTAACQCLGDEDNAYVIRKLTREESEDSGD